VTRAQNVRDVDGGDGAGTAHVAAAASAAAAGAGAGAGAGAAAAAGAGSSASAAGARNANAAQQYIAQVRALLAEINEDSPRSLARAYAAISRLGTCFERTLYCDADSHHHRLPPFACVQARVRCARCSLGHFLYGTHLPILTVCIHSHRDRSATNPALGQQVTETPETVHQITPAVRL